MGIGTPSMVGVYYFIVFIGSGYKYLIARVSVTMIETGVMDNAFGPLPGVGRKAGLRFSPPGRLI